MLLYSNMVMASRLLDHDKPVMKSLVEYCRNGDAGRFLEAYAGASPDLVMEKSRSLLRHVSQLLESEDMDTDSIYYDYLIKIETDLAVATKDTGAILQRFSTFDIESEDFIDNLGRLNAYQINLILSVAIASKNLPLFVAIITSIRLSREGAIQVINFICGDSQFSKENAQMLYEFYREYAGEVPVSHDGCIALRWAVELHHEPLFLALYKMIDFKDGTVSKDYINNLVIIYYHFIEEKLKSFLKGKTPWASYCGQVKINDGKDSEIFTAKRKTDMKKFALKLIKLELEDNFRDFVQEVKTMALLDKNPNVLGINEIYIDFDHVWIAQEYMNFGNLNSILNATRENSINVQKQCAFENVELINMVRQIALGIKHLHDNNIIHHDISSQHILIDDKGQLKVANHSSIMKVEPGKKINSGYFNTPIYFMAPELIPRLSYDTAIDIWSFGIILIQMLRGGHVPRSTHPSRAVAKKLIAKGAPKLKPTDTNDKALMDLIRKCLTVKPEDRLKADEIIKHEYTQKKSVSNEQLAAKLRSIHEHRKRKH